MDSSAAQLTAAGGPSELQPARVPATAEFPQEDRLMAMVWRSRHA